MECPVCGDCSGYLDVEVLVANTTKPDSEVEQMEPIGILYSHFDDSSPRVLKRMCKEEYVDIVKLERPRRISVEK